jgi:hypothetical protein
MGAVRGYDGVYSDVRGKAAEEPAKDRWSYVRMAKSEIVVIEAIARREV